MDISPWDDLFEFGFTPHLPYNYQSNQLCFNGIDLDNLNFDDIDLPHLDEKFGTEQKPLKNKVLPQPLPNRFGEEGLMIHLKKEVKENNEEMIFPSSKNKKMSCVLVKEEVMENNRELILLPNTNSNNHSCKKRKSCNLEYDEIKKHFGVPITQAAKEMNVGLTLLKRRCRELNIKRWPHRKLKSLEFLIENVKEMGMSNEVAMLEQHRKMLEKLPDLELTEETKKLRQTCFKANYKKRWCLV
ncbi:putative transcription factor Nin-like family [Lupinus albus]|uniref:Putative transcription factor Nin-like family n=1 Tax=Lupinus albus TaxID=3870 RepID=A0A6A4PRZ0_LUPAL|nr:putative transcription factor Nin-like family [Lupinus albus]